MKISLTAIALAAVLAAVFTAESRGEQEPDTASLLPESGYIAGWKAEEEPVYFYSENLWEYINGSADKFVSYRFRELAAGVYSNEKGEELKVEIYRHETPRMAYGIYSQLSYGKEPENRVGNMSFEGPYSLHFWKGPYYVKVAVFEQSPGLKRSAHDFADYIAEKIGEPGTPPSGIDAFPAEGMVPNTITYVAEGALGRGSFPPALTADYSKGDDRGKLYLFYFKDVKEALRMFSEYASELGAEWEKAGADGIEYRKARGKAPYRGMVTVFTLGRVTGVMTGFEESPQAAAGIVSETVKNLGKGS